MEDVEIPPERVQDPQGVYDSDYNRDPARTPMQWNASPNAGFCPDDAKPWLPIAEDHEVVNVEVQQANPHSTLFLFRRLISLRRKLPTLTIGTYHPLDVGNTPVLAFLREHEEQRVLVVLNFAAERRMLDLSGVGDKGEVLCSTRLDLYGHLDLGEIDLRPNEGLLVALGS